MGIGRRYPNEAKLQLSFKIITSEKYDFQKRIPAERAQLETSHKQVRWILRQWNSKSLLK
jgi:hypothetical protein